MYVYKRSIYNTSYFEIGHHKNPREGITPHPLSHDVLSISLADCERTNHCWSLRILIWYVLYRTTPKHDGIFYFLFNTNGIVSSILCFGNQMWNTLRIETSWQKSRWRCNGKRITQILIFVKILLLNGKKISDDVTERCKAYSRHRCCVSLAVASSIARLYRKAHW